MKFLQNLLLFRVFYKFLTFQLVGVLGASERVFVQNWHKFQDLWRAVLGEVLQILQGL